MQKYSKVVKATASREWYSFLHCKSLHCGSTAILEFQHYTVDQRWPNGGPTVAQRRPIIQCANVGPLLGQRCIFANVGPPLGQRCTFANVGPTLSQMTNVRWANVAIQRWANGVADVGPTLGQRCNVIWDAKRSIRQNVSAS